MKLLLILTLLPLQALPPINLFRPSDRPLMPEPVLPCWSSQFSVGYEGAYTIRGFRDDEDECRQIDTCEPNPINKKTNVLHIYQTKHNILSSFKGFTIDAAPGQLSQLFNINDEDGLQGIVVPFGDLKVPMNLLLSYRYYFPYGINLGIHLPVIKMELENVRWKGDVNLLEPICKETGLNVGPWKRTGIGDLVIQGTWMRDFQQVRPLLTNVRPQVRLGLSFPTGEKQDQDKILALPFGNDGSWGIQFAGGLDLTFCYTFRGGIDAEFLYLFGDTHPRRVKSSCNQSDLIFLRKVDAFREFGLSQQYNIYLESCQFWRGLSCKLNYQFLKRNDDRLDVCNDRLDNIIINSAESLDDWTAHSLILMTRYEFWKDWPESPVLPSIMAWAKWGFNGKRAALAHTLGLQLSIAF